MRPGEAGGNVSTDQIKASHNYSIRLIEDHPWGLYPFVNGGMGLSLSAPPEFRSGSPTQFLRQAFDLWPYACIGVSVFGLAYLLLPAIR